MIYNFNFINTIVVHSKNVYKIYGFLFRSVRVVYIYFIKMKGGNNMSKKTQISAQMGTEIKTLAEQRAKELGFNRSVYIEQLIRADLKKAGKIEY